MLDQDLLRAIATQMMSGAAVIVGERALPVRRTRRLRLKTLTFRMGGREYAAIEQNPEKPSRWGRLARAGHKVVQFKDVESNRFVAVAVDAEITEYGGRRKR